MGHITRDTKEIHESVKLYFKNWYCIKLENPREMETFLDSPKPQS